MKINHRRFKDELFAEYARVAGALASPRRLEILDLLAQREWTVDELARETGLSLANASRHLRILAQARLVEATRAGTYVHYRVASLEIVRLCRSIEAVATERLPDVPAVIRRHVGTLQPIDVGPAPLARRVKSGKTVLLDVRPAAEYHAGHIPGALETPAASLSAKRIAALPRDCEIVVYCRGESCVLADEAVAALRRRGFAAHRLATDSVGWALSGRKLEAAS